MKELMNHVSKNIIMNLRDVSQFFKDPKLKNSIHLKWIFQTGISQMSRVPSV